MAKPLDVLKSLENMAKKEFVPSIGCQRWNHNRNYQKI